MENCICDSVKIAAWFSTRTLLVTGLALFLDAFTRALYSSCLCRKEKSPGRLHYKELYGGLRDTYSASPLCLLMGGREYLKFCRSFHSIAVAFREVIGFSRLRNENSERLIFIFLFSVNVGKILILGKLKRFFNWQ